MSTKNWVKTACAVLSLTTPIAVYADIKMGALYPLSGSLALLGDESYRGLELAVAERNAAGGLKGEQIKLFKADAVDAGQAVGAARKLTSVENVTAVFGSYSSALSFAATQVTEMAGVPYFELGAVSDSITERDLKYVMRSNPTAKNFAEGTITAITEIVAPSLKVDPKQLKIAIIHEDALYGTTIAGFQKQLAQEKGLSVVEVLPYSAKAVDLSSLILRLKGSQADVVLQTSYQNDTTLFFRQIREAGFKPKAVIGAGGGYSMQDTVKVVGAENMEGVLDVDFPQFQTNENGAPGISAFTKAYKDHFGSEPRSGHSLINYVGAKIFLDAMEKSPSLEADAIRASVASVDIPVGGTAAGIGAKFAENGQNQRANTAIMQWQSGQLKTVYPEAAAVAKARFSDQP
ncbi:High-affinity leucine-specific transport system, periplasmic binding protein LivK [Pseudomonas synxantha]|uniref:High-affinity leucine-specific transport system, periplasmic binding protein LivK n=1 Tax=Pseudomonas synxantha TaxID=47883 RepID=A0A3G7U7N1_9PSED|nr:ABC transporter substrate-binding protein [Pseudomonas synxantha]AZE55221.1 High-affinity leucine-specific transport system, periplasmic binding protein LivK [Pseudomonas synxantha]